METLSSLDVWHTRLLVAIRTGDNPALQRWLDDLLRREVSELERLASRFRADSELTSVNRSPGRWVETSWEFVSVLTASLDAASATGGLVDPLLGRHIVAAGYDQWAQQQSFVDGPPTTSDWREIAIRPGRTAAAVRIPPGSALDLGAVAKGWLADRLATVVHASTGHDVIANMGGDLRVISPGEPWTVGADPEVPGISACDLELRDAGLATSGVGHRTWRGGHHIIDPRTGKPADTPWFSVSVMAAEAAGANAAATAGLIAGDAGPDWLADMGLDGWFVSWDGEQVREVGVGAWRELRPAACA